MAFVNEEHTKEYIMELVTASKAAQKEFEKTCKDQHSVDAVVRAACMALVTKGQDLSAAAVAETGMGNVQGKMMKLTAAALGAWKQTRGKQSVGYVDSPDEPGVRMKFKPMGVVGAVMPSTNPFATIISNTAAALKCRNSIIIASHPASAHSSDQAIAIIQDAIEAVGAPRNLVTGICADESCVEATMDLLRQCDVNIGTGGPGMVKAVYSAGKPAYGVGQGNCQVIIDQDIPASQYPTMAMMHVKDRMLDNGVPCIGEQTIHVPAENEKAWVEAMRNAGAYVLEKEEQIDRLRAVLFPDGGTRINRKIVGRVPKLIGPMIGEDIPETAGVIFLKNQAWGDQDVLCREILCPIIRYTTYEKFEEAVDRACANLYTEGAGHSSALWTNNPEHIDYASDLFPVGRFHINNVTSGMGTGLKTSTTIGCGTWGGNSISEYLQWYHLYNVTRVTTTIQTVPGPANPMDEFNIWEPFYPQVVEE